MKYFGLIFAGIARKPLRSFLTVASLFIAFLLFGILQSVSKSFETGVDLAGVDRLIIAPKYSIVDMLPVSYLQRIQQVPGVEVIAHQTWFNGTYQDPQNFFPRWPVPPAEFMQIHSEWVLPEAQLQAFINTRTGAIVGRTTAETYGMSVGDKIPFIPDIWANLDGTSWEFDLVGIYDGIDEKVETSQFFFNFEYFDEYRAAGKGTVGNFVITISDPTQANRIANDIDILFANSTSETKTSTEKEYQQMFANQIGDIGFIMTAILGAVFFTIILLTGNTMSQAVRERIPELAILKTLGFNSASLLLIVLGESVILTVFGCLLGLAAAAVLVPEFSLSLAFFVGDMALTSDIVVTAIALSIALGFIVGLPPALRAMRLNIVDALGGHT